ncbi:MAG TPA: AraC family transcriptional regulator ligand-binding domain-containing protein, partial [Spongiibacteraceae bacterium]|nr:AraC family transcriptional regulator ligand-binding domain-containing protein [Spongiibacteraceae bacterium]
MLKTADIVGVDVQITVGGTAAFPKKHSAHTLAAPLSPPQLAATFQALIAELCARSPQRDAQGSPSRDDVDLFCYCLINCDSLGAAIDRAIRFTKISHDRWGELGLYEKNGRHFFFIDSRRHGDAVAPAVIDVFSLSYFYKLFSWLIAEPLPLLQVSLAHARCIDSLNIQSIFGCPVIFASEVTALVFDSSALKKPIVRTYRELVQVLQSLPIALMPLPRTTSVT